MVISLTKGFGISALNLPPLFKIRAKRDLIQRGEICALEGISFALSTPSIFPSPRAESDSRQLLFACSRKLAFQLPLAATWGQFGNPYFAIRNIWSVTQIFPIFLRDTLKKCLCECLSPLSVAWFSFKIKLNLTIFLLCSDC